MATPSISFMPRTSDPRIDGLLSGSYWSLDATHTLTWVLANNPIGGYFWTQPITTANLINSALAEWSKVANINFQYVGHYATPIGAPADLTFSIVDSSSSVGGSALAFALFPSEPFVNLLLAALGTSRAEYPSPEGDIFFNIDWSAVYNFTNPGSLAFAIGLHEIGHALGLKHSHDGGLAGYPTFAQLGLGQLDVDLATVMSYNETSPVWQFGHPATPMVLDILAIQAIYGPNLTTGLGNSRYTLANDGRVRTIWDVGGSDWIDAGSQFQPVTIDLAQAGFSTPGGLSVLSIAFNTVIEHARGGAGGDALLGNNSPNKLLGLGGNDTFAGKGSNDVLIGGPGTDVAIYDGPRSRYDVATANGITRIVDNFGTDGTDLLIGVETVTFSNQSNNVPQQSGNGAIFRFYNVQSGAHFYSASAVERDDVLVRLDEFIFEGAAFRSPAEFDLSGGVQPMPIWRFYNTETGAHFYTMSVAERDAVDANLPTFNLEGIGYHALPVKGSAPDTIPLYRFYNTNSGAHFYTAAEAEKDFVVTLPGFNFEGIAYWVYA